MSPSFQSARPASKEDPLGNLQPTSSKTTAAGELDQSSHLKSETRQGSSGLQSQCFRRPRQENHLKPEFRTNLDPISKKF